MGKHPELTSMAAVIATVFLASSNGIGQTPEQEKTWAADRARAATEEKANAERLAQERAARRADPMAWVRTLDPMSAGGWEFRAVATDGSWATYSSTHQLKRSGQVITVWLRQEYAEPQLADGSRYLSAVQKAQYDCKKEQARDLLVIYYAANNIQGSEQTAEADGKNTPWNAIVPGTREEGSFLWACSQARGAGAK
jgi:hypothetical protein